MRALVAAATAAAAAGPPPIEVSGSSELAAAIGAELGGERERSSERPGTIVETTGEVSEIQAALARVRDLGTVVLVAAPAPDGPKLDLYTDLHVRGLTVVGVCVPPG
jgi:threonine dehydrogenase-like Zn-dependent dehydrogenase